MNRRRLRLAYTLPRLGAGGSERQMLALAERLPRDRFDVSFVLRVERGVYADAAEATGARLHVLGGRYRRNTSTPRFAANAARSMWRYTAVVRRERFDVVDAWLFHAYLAAAIVRPVARTPVLIAGRRSLSDFKAGFGPLERAVDAYARRSADAIVANAQAVADDVIAREGADPAKLRVIRNGVVLSEPMDPERRAALRAGWGAGPAELVVGCVANYKEGKGLELLIATFADVVAAVPGARLVLVGEGYWRPVLEELIAGHGLERVVILHGHEFDAPSVLGAFDVVVQASETEGLPNAVLEAAAAGLPIAATAAGGTGEIVEDGRTGLLVPVADGPALGAALVRLLGDPTLRRDLGAAARERAATTFGMDRFVREFADLYEELAIARGVRLG